MFKFIDSSPSSAAQIISERLNDSLRKHNAVAWIISGGSNIPIVRDVMGYVDDVASRKLTIAFGDERYGSPGHSDSNYRQLIESGINLKNATLFQSLYDDYSIEQTTNRWEEVYNKLFSGSGDIIAQLGLGEDGHTLGILPHYVQNVNKNQLVASYTALDYKRITLTPKALENINVVYVVAFGDKKRVALTKLQQNKINVNDMPAKLLNTIDSVYILNDQIGGSV